MILTADRKYVLNGVTVNEFLITDHNDNNVPIGYDMKGNRIGITVHNTPRLSEVAKTQAEQYARATYNNNMDGVIVHFYVDEVEAWQLLPLDISGFHAADGNGPGNRRTIAVECIMDGSGSEADKKSEENCAKLVAGLLKMFDFGIEDLYTHNHWYPQKYCPAYILPHWEEFRRKVQSYLGGVPEQKPTELYRIRKSWADVSSQIGAYTNLESAKSVCKSGYYVFDEKGNKVYPLEDMKNSTSNISVELRMLRSGMGGKDVEAMQAILIAKGYSCGTYGSDGDFGENTEKAVRNFQTDRKISSDGIVGEKTWAELFR
ncbi:MAG: N-acetylmuramoyl-L-alanine amidase [Oscillospiraceae bacterium]|nr:N-acetylmuramoyl-L-alanine amidase [Oscillospiraceae bacterium]